MEIANSNDYSEIQADWNYLRNHAVPRLNEAIDLHKRLNEAIDLHKEISKVLSLLL